MKTRTKLRNVNLQEHEGDDDEITVLVPEPAAPTDSGRRVGRYLMFEEIARGEMGALHLGCVVGSDARQPVAIKHLYPWLAANSSYASTYLREAHLAARIRHPNVAATIDVVTGSANGEIYLVMDYVHGDTLARLLRQTQQQEGAGPPLAVLAGVMIGLLRGLHAVQEATLAEESSAPHAQREVSPQDVIVGIDGVTRIFEFGAINLAHGHMRELVSGRGADVFSAGAMLWEILAGRRLFGDPADRDVFLTSSTNLIPPPSHFNPEVPAELDAAVLRALRRDRDRRFPSARAFAEAIEAAVVPATPREIGDWVARTSAHLLAARADRIAGITRTAPGPALPEPRAQESILHPRPGRRAAGAIASAVAVTLVVAGLWVHFGAVPRVVPRPTPSTSHAVDSTMPAAASADGIRRPPPGPAPDEAADEPVIVQASGVRAAAVRAAAVRAAAGSRRHRLRARGTHTSLARIARLNDDALKAYRRLDPATARRLLAAALVECARSGLGRHAIAAQTHADLGVVLAGGFKQPDLGAEQFRSALRIDPGVPLPLRYAREPDVAAAFRTAVAADDLYGR